jgi:hypothetical protein
LGHDDAAVWGECQGSGAKPYQVQIDVAEPAFKCSCPSRKFPCKHGLGLALMLAAGQVGEGTRPAWVAEWFAGRTERQQKKQAKAEAPPKPVDAEAQAKRREKRLARVGEGLASLKLWAEDLVRGGIATAPSRGYGFFDEPARRMIDAQAPGIARRVQALGAIAAGSGAGWERPFVEQLASLYLLICAYERIEQLPETTQHDLRAAIGLAQGQEEVLSLAPARDEWQIVAQETTLEDRLRVQRTWLFGRSTRRPAIVLSFAHGTQPLDASLTPGFSFDGDICFFPGSGARALVKSRGELKTIEQLDGLPGLDELCDEASKFRATQPWMEELVFPVGSLAASRDQDGWQLIDRTNRSLPAILPEAKGWIMLAISGGHPANMAVGFDGARLRPLAMIADGQYTSLANGAEVRGE